jgi:hypothetical protein
VNGNLWDGLAFEENVMASFEREKALVEHLLRRMNLDSPSLSDPNANGSETGMDVIVHLADGRAIGIQVTEIDPHAKPGKARAEERRIAGNDQDAVYGMWAQNDPRIILDSLVRSIKRKITIAGRHSFSEVSEVWLLMCAGIPEPGAVVSTFVITPWLSPDDMNAASNSALEGSKYARCFFLPILNAEQSDYRWEKNCGWTKSVRLEDIRDIPRATYVNSLNKAAINGDWQEVDRLCDEECKMVLSEMREN